MIPSWLTEVPETIETSRGFSFISIVNGQRETYIPLYDNKGHYVGHVSAPAETLHMGIC